MHWTRPAEAARRIASATGLSAHHRGTPSSIIIPPSLAHAGAVEPVPTSQGQNLEGKWELSGRLQRPRPHHPKSFLAAQPPAVVFLCSLGHAFTTLPGPESETEVKLDQPHCSTSGKLPHARPGLPVNHRQVGPSQLATFDRSHIIIASGHSCQKCHRRCHCHSAQTGDRRARRSAPTKSPPTAALLLPSCLSAKLAQAEPGIERPAPASLTTVKTSASSR